jgi:hypothetical protein
LEALPCATIDRCPNRQLRTVRSDAPVREPHSARDLEAANVRLASANAPFVDEADDRTALIEWPLMAEAV